MSHKLVESAVRRITNLKAKLHGAQGVATSILSHQALSASFPSQPHFRNFHTNLQNLRFDPKIIEIGETQIPIKSVASSSEREFNVNIPIMSGIHFEDEVAQNFDEETLNTLRWMSQKDSLGQDIFLLGYPGYYRRYLAFLYCELSLRDVEYVSITKDTSEHDLKQRREISNQSSFYVDQAAVRAALNGSILILDGIEKAEHNVMPLINNLLENREMSLEDGRMLISPTRYEQLLEKYSKEQLQKLNVHPVHPNFRVIALGLPVPPFKGNTLDPPLRSRFNCRTISLPSHELLFDNLIDYAMSQKKYQTVVPQISKVIKEFIELAYALQYSSSLMQQRQYQEEAKKSEGTFSVIYSMNAQKINMSATAPTASVPITNSFPVNFLFFKHFIDQIIYEKKLSGKISRDRLYEIITSIYPFDTLLQHQKSFQDVVENIVHQFLTSCMHSINDSLPNQGKKEGVSIESAIKRLPRTTSAQFVPLPEHVEILANMIRTHQVSNFDICVMGPKGIGKSQICREFAYQVGYEDTQVEYFPLHAEMTCRDLIQRRVTDTKGNTLWKNSPLVEAMKAGRLCILDNLDKLSSDIITSLQTLVHHRMLFLFDGTRFYSSQQFQMLQKELNLTRQQLNEKGVFEIHPSFRIVAIANSQAASTLTAANNKWLTLEVMNMFHFHKVPSLLSEEIESLLVAKIQQQKEHLATNHAMPSVEARMSSEDLHAFIQKLIAFQNAYNEARDNVTDRISIRDLVRVATRVYSFYPSESSYMALARATMMSIMPKHQKDLLEKVLFKNGFSDVPSAPSKEQQQKQIQPFSATKLNDHEILVKIQNTESKASAKALELIVHSTKESNKVRAKNQALIPKPFYVENITHSQIMIELIKDHVLNQQSLLIGNQGVGKNKIVDQFLNVLELEREYLQLHRDITVQSLTVQPSVENNVLVYIDSPLVRAVQHGRILVLDEADKAPLEVVSIIKTLIEDGEMVLADGRRIIRQVHESKGFSSPNIIPIHKDFRMIVLANRPGYPFQGNDFFRECGDLFSSHYVSNPQGADELHMLKLYGPSVSVETLTKLCAAFDGLRNLVDLQLLNYPYSTRELVNIVKHLEKYKTEDLASAIRNVVDFDSFDEMALPQLLAVFKEHGINIPLDSFGILGAAGSKQGVMYNGTARSPSMKIKYMSNNKEVSSPKHGKEDPTNTPHVGGNTWAGGTGGRDTAGMGGKGGPYRLYKEGHPVYQIPDSEKPKITEAQKAMAQQALQARLQEISMSEKQMDLYMKFYQNMKTQIIQFKNLLENMQAKEKQQQWLTNQSSGEIDDRKIVEAITGERLIYKKRGVPPDSLNKPNSNNNNKQKKPKYLTFVVDCSASMYRFNYSDQRLLKMMETVALILESLYGYEQKFVYKIVAHSGDSDWIPLVNSQARVPQNELDRLRILLTMHAHSQYCTSGDETISATMKAVEELAAIPDEEADDKLVFVFSDANFDRYAITSKHLTNAITYGVKDGLKKNPRAGNSSLAAANPLDVIKTFFIFIASMEDEAAQLVKELPKGRAFVCTDTSKLTQVFGQIFQSNVLQN